MGLKKLNKTFIIKRMNLTDAGYISSEIKRVLKQENIDPKIIRRIAIASYEAEINVVIHSLGGKCIAEIFDNKLSLTFIDKGPGIDSIELALSEGYSTANAEARLNGFGAGMGLPNIKNAADEFFIDSSKKGTNLRIVFNLL